MDVYTREAKRLNILKEMYTLCDGNITATMDFKDLKFKLPDFDLEYINSEMHYFNEKGITAGTWPIWDKFIIEKWNFKRNKLKSIDIKILHHLYNCGIFKSNIEIKVELGFSNKQIVKSINILLEPSLVVLNQENKIKICNNDEIYFVKEIISIEAKLHVIKLQY